MNPFTLAMFQIKALDPEAHLCLSEYSGQWYVSARIEIGNGSILSGITEHRDIPAEAVSAYLERLQKIGRDEFIVTNAYRSERREWRWNGGAWTEYHHDLSEVTS